MSIKSRELREKRQELYVGQMKPLADKMADAAQSVTADEERQWTEMNADYDRFTSEIEAEEASETAAAERAQKAADRAAELEKINSRQAPRREPPRQNPGEQQRQNGPNAEQGALALQAWMLTRAGEPIEERHSQAAQACGVSLNSHALRIALPSWDGIHTGYERLNQIREGRASMAAGDAALGASWIPEGFVNNLERSMLAFGGIMKVAEIMTTATGEALPWPTTNDTGNSGEIIGENTTVAEQEIATGAVVFGSHIFSSKEIRVSNKLLRDSAFNMAAVVGSMAGERIGRRGATAFAVGTGANQPTGLVVGSGLGKTAASATAITFDELLDLQYSVDPAYRDPSLGAGWVMHNNIALVVRKLKNGSGDYIWQPSAQVGQPDLLLGDPVTIDQAMQSSVATGTKTVLYGALRKYKIRMVGSIVLRVLVERRALENQTSFVAFQEMDGALLDAGTDPVKHLIQA